MKFAFAFILLIGACSAKNLFTEEWEMWKAYHGKTYSPLEEMKRQVIWHENLAIVTKHNLEFDQGIHTHELGMNKFADLSLEEWKEMILMPSERGVQDHICNSTFVQKENVLKKHVNWVKKGYVTPIKDQGQCGSCWAFSTTGSIEGQHFAKTGTLVSLSEQNLMDCSKAEGDLGCHGGIMDFGFEYVYKNGGVDTEKSYPYTAKDGDKCLYDPKNLGATITGCVDVKSQDEGALAEAVAKIGPISVAIDAGHSSFQLYKAGIYSEKACSSTKLDHGVLAVGYGENENGEEYWIIKNSWGTVWGMEGYVHMARNKGNMCGVSTQASYPTV